MKSTARTILLFITAGVLFACSNDNGDDGPEEQLPIVFEVDPLLYKQYDIDISDIYSNVQVYAWAVFTVQPTARQYTLTYTCETFPHLSFSISWENGQAIPSPGAPPPGWIPNYELGIINGQYHIIILGSGCQSGLDGPCQVGGEGPNTLESNLRDIQGTVEVRVEF